MTKKTLEQMLVEQKELANATGRWAAFLTVWDEVRDTYAKGWKYKEIWKVLHEAGMYRYSYSTFMYCIQRMKRRQEEVAGDGGGKAATPKPAPNRPAPKPPSAAMPGSNRVELPVFGDGVKERDPRRF